jgi:hypothetical protein
MTDTNMPTSAPSRKVVAATGGAGAGAVTAGLILWALDSYVFSGGVPDPVSAFVLFFIPTVLAYLVGYLTTRGPEEVEQPVAERVAQVKEDSAVVREIRDHLAVLAAGQRAATSKVGVAVKKAVVAKKPTKRATKKPEA